MIEKKKENDRKGKGEEQKSTPKMKAGRVIPHLSPTPEKSQSSGQVLLVSKIGMRRALHT